jgi:hypothetical protein
MQLLGAYDKKQDESSRYAALIKENIHNKYYELEQNLLELHKQLADKNDVSNEEKLSYIRLVKQVKEDYNEINRYIKGQVFTSHTTRDDITIINTYFHDTSRNIENNLVQYLREIDLSLAKEIHNEETQALKHKEKVRQQERVILQQEDQRKLEEVREKIFNRTELFKEDIKFAEQDCTLSMIMVGRELLHQIHNAEEINPIEITKNLYDRMPSSVKTQFSDSFAGVDDEAKINRMNHLLGIACITHALQTTNKQNHVFEFDNVKNIDNFIKSYNSSVTKANIKPEENHDVEQSSTIGSVWGIGKALASSGKAIITSTIKPENLNFCSLDGKTHTVTINAHLRGGLQHRSTELFPHGAKFINIQKQGDQKQGDQILIGIGQELTPERKARSIDVNNKLIKLITEFKPELSVLGEPDKTLKRRVR